MNKRPDAEKFLDLCQEWSVVLGIIGVILGFIIWFTGEPTGAFVIGIGAAFLLCAISILICIRFHNVLLDIRDAEYETVRLLNSIKFQTSNYEAVETSSIEEDEVNIVIDQNDELQAWKDSQILRAKSALQAGKITENKYISYVNKVTACKKIPESYQSKPL